MKITFLPTFLCFTLIVPACGDAVATTDTLPTTSGSTDSSSTAPSTDPTSGVPTSTSTTSTTTGTSTTVTSTDTTTTVSTTEDSTTTQGLTTGPDTDTSSSTASTSSTTGSTTEMPPDCTPGEELCICINGTTCNSGKQCKFGECPPLSGMCNWEADGFCDEPDSCAPGTDIYDCCATPNNGVCEEVSGGGTCPKGSDWWDCSLCPFTDNQFCDEPVDCPPDSDPDCDFCEWKNDGYCDEPDLCPPGSDSDDCCASIENGVCEEIDQGGMCPSGTDFYDCGECPWPNDGYCDEPYCPPGSDGGDCCAIPENGVCEEIDQGGMCPEGSDWYDCGECQWANDGYCDEPDLCPPGSDGDDCCATPENGACEEIDQGGMCPEGSDWYDCGECQWANDGYCDEPDLCPPGSDGDDCCAAVNNGTCEEVGQGGMCPDGSDYYDCGECPWENDFECDVPQLCPPGSDVNDCP